MVCGNCGQTGHYRTTCTNGSMRVADGGAGIYECGICGQYGHNRRTCPRNQSQGRSSRPSQSTPRVPSGSRPATNYNNSSTYDYEPSGSSSGYATTTGGVDTLESMLRAIQGSSRSSSSYMQSGRSSMPFAAAGLGLSSSASTSSSSTNDRRRGNGNDDDAGIQWMGRIGKGGFGEVWKARVAAYGTDPVAVKVIPALNRERLAASERAVFEKEVNALRAVQSDYVAKILGTLNKTSKGPGIVMKLYHGDLESQIPRGGLDETKFKRYITHIVQGLIAVHSTQTVFRDLKPQNCLYDRDTDRIVLTDFGIARVISRTNSRASTRTRGAGTDCYMDKVAWMNSHYTLRTDMHTLAQTAWHMWTGRQPEDGDGHELNPAPLPQDMPWRALFQLCQNPVKECDRPSSREFLANITS